MGHVVIGGTLFRRFFARAVAGVGIAVFAFVAVVHLFQARVIDAEWREELRQEAVWLAKHSHVNVGKMLADAWKTMHSSVRITIYDAEGAVVGDSHPERAPIDVGKVQRGEEPRGQLAVAEDVPGGGQLVMSRPYIPAFPAGMYPELGISLLLILGPLVLLLYPLARSMSTTLRDIGQMAGEVSLGHLGKTLTVPRSEEKGELGALVRSFNDMSLKLAEAERLSSRLLHDVSHELRSPLGRIQVLADTIAERPGERDECLRGIEREIQLLDRLVADLLQVARIESGQRMARLETFSVQHWGIEILSRLERSVRSQGIEWTARFAEEDAEARGDPQHLALALSNLVDNAVHALRGRPEPSIEVDVAVAGRSWSLTVSDNGPGIPEEHLPHVFRRFYRADEHRNREAGGVGLGLSLVSATAEAHGGHARIESRVDQGTRVTLSLPLAPPSEA